MRAQASALVRRSVRQMPIGTDWCVNRHEGPCRPTERDANGEPLRFETREEAEAALAQIEANERKGTR